MDHLGGADAVDDAMTGRLLPGIERRSRQMLAGGDERAYRAERLRPGLREQGAVGRGCREHARGAEAGDSLAQVIRRRPRHHRRGSAEAQWKHELGAQTVGEGKRRGAGEHIVRPRREQVRGKGVRHREHVAVKMHRGLGLPGGARGEGEQAGIVLRGVDGGNAGRLRCEAAFELAVAPGERAQATIGAFETAELRGEAHLAQRMTDARLVDDGGELAPAQERHRRDHDGPDARHGQPRGVQHHRVAGAEQDAVAGLDPHVAREHAAQSIDQVLEPAIAPVALGRADGERVAGAEPHAGREARRHS